MDTHPALLLQLLCLPVRDEFLRRRRHRQPHSARGRERRQGLQEVPLRRLLKRAGRAAARHGRRHAHERARQRRAVAVRRADRRAECIAGLTPSNQW